MSNLRGYLSYLKKAHLIVFNITTKKKFIGDILLMKRILVMGASKGIGLETVQKAIDSRYLVRAFARSAYDIGLNHSELEKFRGNALDRADVCEALKDVDVVVQSLGVGLKELFASVSLFSEATVRRHRV